MESDTGWATDVTDYDKIGSPMGGDRRHSATCPADGFDVYHAEDVHAATPQIHAPWDEASPPGAGYGIISDGTKWEVSSAPIALTSSLHNAVTLDTDAAAILDLQGTGGQEIGLDTQTANTVLAGPTTGAANEPTFRALVAADVGTGTPDTTKYLRDDMSWQVVTTHDAVTLDADAAAILDLQGAGGQEIGLDVQTANTVFAGPASGVANEPTFRALVFADIPNRKVDTITSDTTLDDTYDVVIVDASGGDVVVTLPDAMANDGKEYAIKRIDSSANSVTIQPTVNYLVDDSGDYLIDDDGAYLVDDGSTNLEGEANGLDINQYDAMQIVADADADSWWII